LQQRKACACCQVAAYFPHPDFTEFQANLALSSAFFHSLSNIGTLYTKTFVIDCCLSFSFFFFCFVVQAVHLLHIILAILLIAVITWAPACVDWKRVVRGHFSMLLFGWIFFPHASLDHRSL
jgi:hypothetical protein